MTPPGLDTNQSLVSPEQMLVLVYPAESSGASGAKCLAQIDIMPRFKSRSLRCALSHANSNHYSFFNSVVCAIKLHF